MTVRSATISTSQSEVTKLLESKPSRKAIMIRLVTIEDLLQQVREYCPWPALEQSLAQDVDRLRAALEASPEGATQRKVTGHAYTKMLEKADRLRAAKEMTE